MGVNQFDIVAPVYNLIGRLVFRDLLIESQTFFLDQINRDDQILIIGGGTGKLLDILSKCEKIDYLEKSKKMIEIAGKRNSANNTVFIHEDFLKFESTLNYRVVICPFVLDCFDEHNLRLVLTKTKDLLVENGVLIVTDFDHNETNATLSRMMHLFFRIFAQLESQNLKPIHDSILEAGFTVLNEKLFHQNMIFSRVYRNL